MLLRQTSTHKIKLMSLQSWQQRLRSCIIRRKLYLYPTDMNKSILNQRIRSLSYVSYQNRVQNRLIARIPFSRNSIFHSSTRIIKGEKSLRYDGQRYISRNLSISDRNDVKVDHDNDKSIIALEDMYTKLTNHEHILLRPNMYIGSTDDVSVAENSGWVYDIDENRMKTQTDKSAKFSPALLKIVDEILVNACDQKVRRSYDAINATVNDVRSNGTCTDRIKVMLTENEISIENNGAGIPVEIHRQSGDYLPSMLFGSLYTGSNFIDTKKQVVGG